MSGETDDGLVPVGTLDAEAGLAVDSVGGFRGSSGDSALMFAGRNRSQVGVSEDDSDDDAREAYYDPSSASKAGFFKAIRTADERRVRELVASGVDLGKRAETGDTALTLAVKHGQQAIVRLLLEAGADPMAAGNRRDRVRSGEPGLPLSIAAQKSQAGIATLLLAAGADVNASDVSGTTALHWAALLGSSRTLQMLLAAGAKVDAETDYGATPLHYAAMGYPDDPRRGRSQAGTLGVLIAAGADVSVRTEPRDTVIENALDEVEPAVRAVKWHERLEIAHLNGTGRRTPLHLYAADPVDWYNSERETGPAKVLVEAGAARFPRDQFGKAPDDYLSRMETFGAAGRDLPLVHYLTGEPVGDGGDEVWAVALSAVSGLAAREAGLDADAATAVAKATYSGTASAGVGGGLAEATRTINQQLEARQREIATAAQDLEIARTTTSGTGGDAATRIHSEAVARSQRFEQCLNGGGNIRECQRKSETVTASANGNSPDRIEAPDRGGEAETKPGAADNETMVTVDEALAICWRKTESDWFCAGPIQTLWTSEDTRETALRRVGCERFRAESANVRISRSDRGEKWETGTTGTVFFCGRPLVSYDQDVRNGFDFVMPSNPSPRQYECPAFGVNDEYHDTDACDVLQ